MIYCKECNDRHVDTGFCEYCECKRYLPDVPGMMSEFVENRFTPQEHRRPLSTEIELISKVLTEEPEVMLDKYDKVVRKRNRKLLDKYKDLTLLGLVERIEGLEQIIEGYKSDDTVVDNEQLDEAHNCIVKIIEFSKLGTAEDPLIREQGFLDSQMHLNRYRQKYIEKS